MSRVHNYVMAQDLTILGIPASILKADISACSAVFISVLPDVICMVWNAGFFPRMLSLLRVDLDCEVTEVRGSSVVTSRYQQSNYISSTS